MSQLPALIAETPLRPQLPLLDLSGCERGGRPQVARFDAADATAAATAADLRARLIIDEAGRTLALQLTGGRILPSGRRRRPLPNAISTPTSSSLPGRKGV